MVGREKKNKPSRRGGAARGQNWADETPEAEAAPDIWINSAPRTAADLAHDQERSCLLRWGQLEWYASVDDVYQTATDLATAAAYADMIAELMHVGLDGNTVTQMLQAMLSRTMDGRTPVMGGMMGTANTLGVMPAGSSQRKAGLVMLKRGAMTGTVSPEGARTMAGHWTTVASATEHDELVALALADILGRGDGPQVSTFLEYMGALRDLDTPDREKFRAAEAERLRLHLGMDK